MTGLGAPAMVALCDAATESLLQRMAALTGLSAEATRDALTALLAELGAQWGDASAVLGADYYATEREAARAGGRFTPVLADEIPWSQWSGLAVWGVSPLFQATPEFERVSARVTGGFARKVADQYRGTVIRSSIEDPASQGWRRVGTGDCEFCRMLINRGAVYRTSTNFRSHDGCNCSTVPAF